MTGPDTMEMQLPQPILLPTDLAAVYLDTGAGIPRETLRRRIYNAAAAGKIKNYGAKGRHSGARWSLAELERLRLEH